MNVTNQNHLLVRNELGHYFINLTVCYYTCTLHAKSKTSINFSKINIKQTQAAFILHRNTAAPGEGGY